MVHAWCAAQGADHLLFPTRQVQERQRYEHQFDTIYKWTDWSEWAGRLRVVLRCAVLASCHIPQASLV